MNNIYCYTSFCVKPHEWHFISLCVCMCVVPLGGHSIDEPTTTHTHDTPNSHDVFPSFGWLVRAMADGTDNNGGGNGRIIFERCSPMACVIWWYVFATCWCLFNSFKYNEQFHFFFLHHQQGGGGFSQHLHTVWKLIIYSWEMARYGTYGTRVHHSFAFFFASFITFDFDANDSYVEKKPGQKTYI